MATYETVRLLGRGTYGTVELARQLPLGRLVALKKITADSGDVEILKRFHREAKVLATLAHPGIVRLFEVGEDGGRPFIAMEYVEGESLASLIEERSLTPERADAVFADLLEALAHLHEQGIAHRDLKPANVMLQSSGRVKLVDFGLSKGTQAATLLTAEGCVVGTAPYLAPECFDGADTGAVTDLWAAACLYHELHAGERAYPGMNLRDIIEHIVTGAPKPLGGTGARFDARRALLARMLDRDPAKRFASAGDALVALRPLADADRSNVPGPPTERRPALTASQALRAVPTRRASRVLAVVSVVALLAWAAARPRAAPEAAASPPPASAPVTNTSVATGAANRPISASKAAFERVIADHAKVRAAWERDAVEIKPALFSLDAKRLARGQATTERIAVEAARELVSLSEAEEQLARDAAPDMDVGRAHLAACILGARLESDWREQGTGVFRVAISEKLDDVMGAPRLLALDHEVQYDPAILPLVERFFELSLVALRAAVRDPAVAPAHTGYLVDDHLALAIRWSTSRFRGDADKRFRAATATYIQEAGAIQAPGLPLGPAAAGLFQLGVEAERARGTGLVARITAQLEELEAHLPGARDGLRSVADRIRIFKFR